MVKEPDPSIKELLPDTTEKLCVRKPDKDTVESFPHSCAEANLSANSTEKLSKNIPVLFGYGTDDLPIEVR